jgi:hypothetical protein
MSTMFHKFQRKYDVYETRDEDYMNGSEFGYQHDLANDDAKFTCAKIDHLNGFDPQLRFISLGIVNMVEPLKNEITTSTPQRERRRSFPRKLRGYTSTNSIKYVIYDNVYQNVLQFDINDLYKRYIKYDVDHIDTTYGKYRLSMKTILEIKEIVKNGYCDV